ncbi:Asp23/Gls24 family envelope stress response protein [Streptomyces sp. CA2R106]|uniref:Asp23/Gls24 family envelope stress response protein n=1 Tax=Streptomyces sp. CA2R106 TaxID=3120153 RepID=UPI003009525C
MAMTDKPSGRGRMHGPVPEQMPGDERLVCGRMLSDVWETEGGSESDQHARTCPYCMAALADLDLLGAAVLELRSGGAPQDTEYLAERVMDLVRLEPRSGRRRPFGDSDGGTWFDETEMARVLCAAAESLPGVRAGSCCIMPIVVDELYEPFGSPDAGVRAGGAPVRVRLEVALPFVPGIDELEDRVRQEVLTAADRQLGMHVASVDLLRADCFGGADCGGPGR